MKFVLTVMALCSLLLLICRCRNDRSKKEHHSTTPVCDNRLFVETFTIFGSGAYGGDRVSDYLTDSTTFRIYIGTFDDAHGGYSYQCNGDSVKVYRVVNA